MTKLLLLLSIFSLNSYSQNIPEQVNPTDSQKISNLLPTTYFVPQEKNISCVGQYGGTGPVYNGKEKSQILELDGSLIATVCTRFLRYLNMEGSAILKDRGHGEVAINYSGVVGSQKRFHALDRCSFGEGTRRDLCLLPYHTLAADNKVHKIGDVIYVPKADGIVLPDGSIHEGFFIVRDTGGAFTGVGGQRVDMFTGTDPDNDNKFREAGFQKTNPLEAYKISGASAEAIKLRLKDKFEELY
jgi:3D (Asp-Asp-Asp) domain-containing protein